MHSVVSVVLSYITIRQYGWKKSHLASLVLGDLVLGVLMASLGLAIGPAGFGDVDLFLGISNVLKSFICCLC